jgi:hypothetical protein
LLVQIGSQFSHTIKQASGGDRTNASESGYAQSRRPSARTGTTESGCIANREDKCSENDDGRARTENEGEREDGRTKVRARGRKNEDESEGR